MTEPHAEDNAAAGVASEPAAALGSSAIMSASPDGILAVDAQGIIQVCNPAAEDMLVRSAEELIGTPFGFPLVAGETSDIDLVLPDGRAQVVEMRVTSTILEGNQFYVTALRDVTRRSQAERDLQAALERQNVMVAVAAHELHNPLAAISVAVHMLRQHDVALSENKRTVFLGRIAENTERLQALVNKLLTASKIDADQTPPDRGTVGVLDLLLERVADFRNRSADTRVLCNPGIVVLVDRGELSEMVTNYLENAFAHGRPPVQIEVTAQGGWVEIRVRDHGAGVPEEFVPHLFERFSRAPPAARGAEGSGLGLWIVRSLARANGGDAWHEPNPGGGACFCLRLPVP